MPARARVKRRAEELLKQLTPQKPSLRCSLIAAAGRGSSLARLFGVVLRSVGLLPLTGEIHRPVTERISVAKEVRMQHVPKGGLKWASSELPRPPEDEN